MVMDELETHLSRVGLDYRQLWHDEANRMGLVAETLADALGWKPTDEQLLPDALELAATAAWRIRALEMTVLILSHKPETRQHYLQSVSSALN